MIYAYPNHFFFGISVIVFSFTFVQVKTAATAAAGDLGEQ